MIVEFEAGERLFPGEMVCIPGHGQVWHVPGDEDRERIRYATVRMLEEREREEASR